MCVVVVVVVVVVSVEHSTSGMHHLTINESPSPRVASRDSIAWETVSHISVRVFLPASPTHIWAFRLYTRTRTHTLIVTVHIPRSPTCTLIPAKCHSPPSPFQRLNPRCSAVKSVTSCGNVDEGGNSTSYAPLFFMQLLFLFLYCSLFDGWMDGWREKLTHTVRAHKRAPPRRPLDDEIPGYRW